jgi:hypothetical protein
MATADFGRSRRFLVPWFFDTTTSYAQALGCLLVLQALYFSPLLFKGQVIFAHTNDERAHNGLALNVAAEMGSGAIFV